VAGRNLLLGLTAELDIMFEDCTPVLQRAEEIAATRPVNEVLAELRNLCLWDFSYLLLSMPQDRWPNLSRVLPRMASDDVQRSWTGAAGSGLLATTVDFVRMLSVHFTRLRHRTLENLQVMDYGCGYGRIMRPLYYFTNPDHIWGLDPWDRSLQICREDGVLGHLAQSEYLPTSLPVPETGFDLIYSYSVFTHTSLEATKAALTVLRRYIAPNGLLVITTRPFEYWGIENVSNKPDLDQAYQEEMHRRDGFSFFPSAWNLPADGKSIFGDTSIDPSWISQTFPGWAVRGYDRGVDTMQTLILLTPR